MDDHLRIFSAAAICAVFLLLAQYQLRTAALAEMPLIHNESVNLSQISYVPVVSAEGTTTAIAVESAPEEPSRKVIKPKTEAEPKSEITSPYGRLSIPSIGLSKNIGAVGLTEAGNMGVLNDPTRVGWFKDGTAPGNVGSAVLDAHVYQAFGKLKDVNVGNDIYVEKQGGAKLHFVVQEVAVYAYTDTGPLKKIFEREDTARLNLITCYGQLISDHSTYTHRLVVYATLAE